MEESNFLAAPVSSVVPGEFSRQSRVVGILCGLSDEFVVAAIEPIGHLVYCWINVFHFATIVFNCQKECSVRLCDIQLFSSIAEGFMASLIRSM